MDKLVFQTRPSVMLGTNTFVNVPIILQFDQTPLIEVTQVEQAGYTVEIPIYHEDGTYLTKAVGSRLHETAAGKKAGVTLDHLDKITVCKLNGRVLFEIRRDEAASLKTAAELYTPSGFFVRYTNDNPRLIDSSGKELRVGGMVFTGNRIANSRIGVLIESNGSVSIGCN